METEENARGTQVLITAQIVQAYLSHNHVGPADLPNLIRDVHACVRALDTTEPQETAEPAAKVTAAQIRRSIKPDGLVSFEDGKTYKVLRRHLGQYGLTPEAYREKWGLPADYPMVAPEYAARRSALAKSLGLGRGGRAANRAADATEGDTEAAE
jgi:predicted transcriptional regulator